MRLVLLAALVGWAGVALLLSELRWFRRRPLVDRLRPYSPGGGATTAAGAGGPGVMSLGSVRDVLGPLASGLGERLARVLGVDEPAAVRLERVHAESDATAFRLRQLGWTGAGAATGAAATLVAGIGAVGGLFVVLGGGVLAFLIVEQQLASRSAAWQRRLFLELPVVAEQLGMLLSAGYSLGAALQRLATRGSGAVGTDLRLVRGRIRQGLSEVEALREWAALARVDALDRLVAVLALNREAGDLGRLISEEARGVRRDVQRELTETIERRSQQVWIPVTVATLLPGVLFLAVPFIDALRVFSEP
ncbi:MAG: type II secretion system F family protein [Acidimicrobiia bacterium]|nr:type II secretion system F family protein [Acidimicrobiia bacterium]